MASRSNYDDTIVVFSQVPGESNVPNNPVAKLMYYLYCLAQTLNLPNEASFNCHSDYAHFSGLGRDEKKELVSMCEQFNPDLLVGKVFFRSESASHANEFTELRVSTTGKYAKSVEIGGQRYLVQKIMTFKQSWLDNYYEQPLSDLKSELLRPSVLQFWRSQLARGLRNNGVSDSSLSPTSSPCCCEIEPVNKDLAAKFIGLLMIVFAVGDLIATSVNIGNGGADKIGSGIWLGFSWGMICGTMMVLRGNDWMSCFGLGITLPTFVMHLIHVGYLFGYAMSADARASHFDFSSMPAVNGVEAFFGFSLFIMDTITLILVSLSLEKCL